MGNKAVFLDRDGTIARDVHYCRRPEDFKLFKDVPISIKKLNENGYKTVLITNQSGIARGYFTENTLSRIHQKMIDELAAAGATIDAIYYCPHHPDQHCDCRKPGTALFRKAAKDLDIDLVSSYMIGDTEKDINAGKKAGCTTVLVTTGPKTENEAIDRSDYSANSFKNAIHWILSKTKKAK
jgi:D,D-heptose 1,7-bisphosphate phosphatase